MSTGIADVLADIGNEKIQYQLLSTSVTNVSVKQHDTEVTFATNQLASFTGLETKEAVIIWVDRNELINSTRNVTELKEI